MINVRACLFLILVFVSTHSFVQNKRDTIFFNWLNKELSQGQIKIDSVLKIKYLNDTLGFINFPNTLLPDSLIPNRAISYWELNFNRGGQSCTNLYRSTKGENRSNNDTLVLTKSNDGFGTVCPPGWCTWYISTKLKNGKTETVTNWKTLSAFIGKIDNPFDAYFWLTCFTHSDSKNIPLRVSGSSKYKIINDGYLIIVNLRVNDCPITSADILYFVRKDKNVTYIQILNTTEYGGCI